MLDDEEAIAIAVALRSSAAGGIAGIEETSVRALTKIIRTMPPRLRARVDTLRAVTAPAQVGGGPTVSAAAIAVIAQACQDRERLRFEYTVRGGDQATRLVEPDRLVTLGRRWYLIAWDTDRDDWRTFRVDRLRDPRSTRYRFGPREMPGGDATAFVRRQLRSMAMRYAVDVTIQASAATVLGWVGDWAEVEALADDRCRMRMAADALDWPVMILAALDAEVEVHGPDELRARMGGVASRFGRAVG